MLPVQLDNYSNRKDKTVTLRFITQEQTPEQIAGIHSLIDTFGYLCFKAEEALTGSELKELDELDTDLMEGGKTQSKRIKNVLYLNWSNSNEGFDEFKDYYKNKTEKIIQFYKDKLD